MEFHPVANIFPMMSAEELAALKADIQANGLREPIWTQDDQIIDGRNRYNACESLGVEPRFREWDGKGSLVAFVVSLNLIRRHLNETQRGMVGARLANMPLGGAVYRSANLPTDNVSQTEAAELLNVSERTIRDAKQVLAAQPEIIELCDAGKMAASAAASIADAPPEFQQKVAEAIQTGEAKSAKDAIRLARRAEIEAATALPTGKYRILYADPPWKYGDDLTENYGGTRYHYPSMTIGELCEKIPVTDMAEERREERIAKIIAPLQTVGRFPLIYADPPWQYDFSVDDADQIENHYPTMTLEDICALPVGAVATGDCVLFLWATSPKLEEAIAVVTAWGFTYRTCAVWDKEWIGPGYYFRQRHELLLIGTRGSLPVPAQSDRPDSIFAERRTEHSRKPEIAYQLIERMYPELPKLELFARIARPGWSVWGNEAALAQAA